MKLVKMLVNDEPRWGILKDGKVDLLKKAPYEEIVESGERVDYDETKLLAPCDPTKIVAIGKNYYDHALEVNEPIPDNPTIFIKPSTCLNVHLGEVEYAPLSKRVDYEGELAFVVKKTAKKVSAANAAEYILGYTCLNDVTARDIQKSDAQWARGKGYDGFAPVGPILTDEVDPSAGIEISTYLNGELKQHSNTDKLMWNIPYLLEFITECMTLLPGDVVTTGTPAGIGPMERGDRVEVRIEGIGSLINVIK
ncbi:MAG: fumarylacetoacetate hydrolase family protein [Clostridia bacterium]|nr:fumarylacetoacetate hydrolase family protein [Clostridia bacterium]